MSTGQASLDSPLLLYCLWHLNYQLLNLILKCYVMHCSVCDTGIIDIFFTLLFSLRFFNIYEQLDKL